MQAANVSREKALSFDYLARNAKAIATLNDSIFYFAELSMQEVKTARLMCECWARQALRSSATFQDSPVTVVQPADLPPRSLRSIPSTMLD